MGTMTATKFSKNIKRTLDRLEFGGEKIIIVRNNHKIARLIPGSQHLTAIEAMADFYNTLPPELVMLRCDVRRRTTARCRSLRSNSDSDKTRFCPRRIRPKGRCKP